MQPLNSWQTESLREGKSQGPAPTPKARSELVDPVFCSFCFPHLNPKQQHYLRTRPSACIACGEEHRSQPIKLYGVALNTSSLWTEGPRLGEPPVRHHRTVCVPRALSSHAQLLELVRVSRGQEPPPDAKCGGGTLCVCVVRVCVSKGVCTRSYMCKCVPMEAMGQCQ